MAAASAGNNNRNSRASNRPLSTSEEVILRREAAEQRRRDLPLCHPIMKLSWIFCGISSGILVLAVILILAGVMAAGGGIKNNGMSVVYAGVFFVLLSVVGYIIYGIVFWRSKVQLITYMEQHEWLKRRSSRPMSTSVQIEMNPSSTPPTTTDRGRPQSYLRGQEVPPLTNGGVLMQEVPSPIQTQNRLSSGNAGRPPSYHEIPNPTRMSTGEENTAFQQDSPEKLQRKPYPLLANRNSGNAPGNVYQPVIQQQQQQQYQRSSNSYNPYATQNLDYSYSQAPSRPVLRNPDPYSEAATAGTNPYGTSDNNGLRNSAYSGSYHDVTSHQEPQRYSYGRSTQI